MNECIGRRQTQGGTLCAGISKVEVEHVPYGHDAKEATATSFKRFCPRHI